MRPVCSINLALLMLLALTPAGTASAQCGAGIPSAGNPNCIPPDVYHSQGIQQQATSPQPVVIRQKWEDRWGAMALDSVHAISGASVSMRSKRAAIRAAKSECIANGGVKCDNTFEYKNGCGAVLAKVGGGVVFTAAATEDMAVDHGMNICAKEGKACEVYYLDCSHAEAVPVR